MMVTRLSEVVLEWLGWCPNAQLIRTTPAVLVVPPDTIHPVQPGGSGPAGSHGRIRNGVRIAMGSLKATFRDRQLLRFTFLSILVLSFLIVAEGFSVTYLWSALPFIFSIPFGDSFITFDTRFFIVTINFGDSFLSFEMLLFVIEMICLSCFTILLAGLVLFRADNRAQQPVTIRRILGSVRTHATTLAALSVTMALFGTLLNTIIYDSLFFGKIVFTIEMAVFNLPYAYYLQSQPLGRALYFSFEIMFINSILFLIALYVVPVIVLEKKGLVPAMAGSVRLMITTWRELLGCAIIYGAIILGVAALALVIGQSPLLLNHDYDFFINMSRGQPLMMTVCFLFLTAYWVMLAAGFTAAGIAITDLHSCGAETIVKKEQETGSAAATGPAV